MGLHRSDFIAIFVFQNHFDSKVNTINMKQAINTSNALAAIGPYSQAIEANGFVYVSGQLPINPSDGTMPNDIKEQTRQSLDNLKAILAERGLGPESVVKTTVFLADMSLFAPMNEVYAEFFSAPFPARCAFAVKELPKQALVEIEAVAAIG